MERPALGLVCDLAKILRPDGSCFADFSDSIRFFACSPCVLSGSDWGLGLALRSRGGAFGAGPL